MSEAGGAPLLSAVVMTYNERRVIGRCLDAALAACDEVVVVDDVSTDGTWEYVKTRPVRAVQHRHTTFAAQRELGKSHARGKWILTLDADEYVTPELARAMREAIQRPDAPDGFYVPHRSPYPSTLSGEVWVYPPRLVRADRCRWVQTDDPHSPLEMRGLRFEVLEGGHLEHEPLPDLATVLRKSINRSLIVAAQQRARGRRGGAWRLLGSFAARFFKFYLGKRAFRYGADGVAMSLAVAFEALAKHSFLIERPVRPPEAVQDGGPGSYPEGAPIVPASSSEGERR